MFVFMMYGQLLLLAIILVYMGYGIVKTVKNKNLTFLHKIVWIVIIISLPVLGASAYLRTTFTPGN